MHERESIFLSYSSFYILLMREKPTLPFYPSIKLSYPSKLLTEKPSGNSFIIITTIVVQFNITNNTYQPLKLSYMTIRKH